jgi:hypothetical protein
MDVDPKNPHATAESAVRWELACLLQEMARSAIGGEKAKPGLAGQVQIMNGVFAAHDLAAACHSAADSLVPNAKN